MKNQRGIAVIWLILIGGVLLVGTGVGGYYAGSNKSKSELADKQESIDTLRSRVAQAENSQPKTTGSPTPGVQGTPGNSTSYRSANLGVSVDVPKEWANQWRYQENGNIGMSTASVTFFLINKETKYQELVTIGKIPQAKYDDAKATGQSLGNADNLLGSKNGNAYVMTFADGANVQFKSFTYEQAVKAARDAFKASFKTL